MYKKRKKNVSQLKKTWIFNNSQAYLDASKNSGKIVATDILYKFFRPGRKRVSNRVSPAYIISFNYQ